MITKEQALLAFCAHCDDRLVECDGCPLKGIIDDIPDATVDELVHEMFRLTFKLKDQIEEGETKC